MKTKKLMLYAKHTAVTFPLLFSLSACGGGGGGGGTSNSPGFPPPLPAKILSWQDPTNFTDGTILDPARDLKELEIYVDQSGIFNNGSVPVDNVGAVDPATGQLINSYDLANLAPFLQQGVTYFVTVRSVGMTGAKSDFANPASFVF